MFTGRIRSREFIVPPRLTFFVCGHLGFPGEAAQRKNLVRLRLAETGAVIAEAVPPRSDVAQPVQWDLRTHAGKKGYVEVEDGLASSAYAWLAVGRFDPPVVAIPTVTPETAARRLRAAAT